jgi:hypothetical protein
MIGGWAVTTKILSLKKPAFMRAFLKNSGITQLEQECSSQCGSQYCLENNAFFEEVVEIKVGDKTESVKIKALQRHPAKNTPMHADFKRA